MGLFGSRKKAGNAAQGGGAEKQVELSDGQTYTVSAEVDCLGDSCPRPQLMTKKAVANAASGDVVKIKVDNPTSMEALPPMCPGMGATHLETVSVDRGWRVYIQKA